MARYEAWCVENCPPQTEPEAWHATYVGISGLYDGSAAVPAELPPGSAAELRGMMRLRAFVAEAEAEQRLACFHACTAEARKLASQFSEARALCLLLSAFCVGALRGRCLGAEVSAAAPRLGPPAGWLAIELTSGSRDVLLQGEFISKMLPDPIEQGLGDALRKAVIPLGRMMRGKV